ncbi:MAG: translesion DNA synthesis-associated protein ImuA [Pseudohongiella sp.]|nr:translesion DNA synthesis-associated protein ImuA [Pseudohongiella sp.]
MHTQDGHSHNIPGAVTRSAGSLSPEADMQTRVKQLLAQTPALWQGIAPANNIYLHPTAAGPRTVSTRNIPTDLFADGSDNPAEKDPATTAVPSQSTGFAELDKLLPWGGWPVSGLIEIVSRHKAVGELQLLMPLLRQRSHQQQSLLWITPPYTLHGPALANSGINIRNSFVIPSQTGCNNALWSIEKALQSTECGMVLAWQNWLSARVVRRLQLAANEGKTLGVLFHQRPVPHSPATLQLEISAAPLAADGSRQLNVRLLKAKGSHRQGEIRLHLPG